MTDYSIFNLSEAAVEESLIEFCEAVKSLDKNVVVKRLKSLQYNETNFYTVIAKFNALVLHKTSVD